MIFFKGVPLKATEIFVDDLKYLAIISSISSHLVSIKNKSKKALLLGRVTSVAINPLLFAFLTIVAVKVMEAL